MRLMGFLQLFANLFRIVMNQQVICQHECGCGDKDATITKDRRHAGADHWTDNITCCLEGLIVAEDPASRFLW